VLEGLKYRIQIEKLTSVQTFEGFLIFAILIPIFLYSIADDHSLKNVRKRVKKAEMHFYRYLSRVKLFAKISNLGLMITKRRRKRVASRKPVEMSDNLKVIRRNA
jgi:hypothetical protein